MTPPARFTIKLLELSLSQAINRIRGGADSGGRPDDFLPYTRDGFFVYVCEKEAVVF